MFSVNLDKTLIGIHSLIEHVKGRKRNGFPGVSVGELQSKTLIAIMPNVDPTSSAGKIHCGSRQDR
jgi:hypothetical protein